MIKKTQQRLKYSTLFILATSLMIIVLWLTARLTYHEGIENLSKKGETKLELYITYLQGVLQKYESLPELLAVDKMLVNALQSPGSQERLDTLNRYLETINSISDASDIYLMDRNGLTIAASNWQSERPFIGRNFSYRPYFKSAMRGVLGRYFALGTTSSRRGYYFAFPVRKDNQILGAVVIKIDIDTIEEKWKHSNEKLLVSDPDGVIFITTQPEWRYSTLYPLAQEVKKRIVDSKRYPNSTLTPLNVTKEENHGLRHTLRVMKEKQSRPHTYLVQERLMPEAGWNVQILSDVRQVDKQVMVVIIVVSSGIILSYLLLLLLWQRRQRLAELHLFEEHSKKVLLDANERLETRVDDRTKELTAMNNQLLREIDDRKRTEEALKKTRSQLTHAAKLAALGQLSAGINHELNQPLAAIRTYTDNGKQFLLNGRYDDTMWNLEQIEELTERMAQIGIQLKVFSRKSSGELGIVPLHGVIDGALEILISEIRKSHAQIVIDLVPENIEVRGNNVMLQQVFVNLIGNALQAMEEQRDRRVDVSARHLESKVQIIVQDNGPGISQDHLDNIFEPFYSTKKPGQGLGLGLTITDRIIREMNGEITVTSSDKGAHFEILLEKVS